ncbi:TPA: nicotinate phosphoribosyltransferase [Legionella pneumophila subsp. pneumophila]|uniref:nicotinate phosphoribosyltransferase n=1 Tax=Legionella sp. PATHC039 TaxID=2992042 RepID=UPI001A287CDF|nr:nicotinate phosphoribosyltransferase [Legionella sp. PATHC039]MCW8396084.1 nicotinate phosphoribosyltransferase [Legionella sp. PATHC039]HAT8860213.1 nicotinate phosphoribosyltransferase [Legionella pneumophila subsp. pneumophila]HAT9649625.1 nicotinate phosphoribosyltransferase [Legionella pneumophila subsp. pneumophila]HAT9919584.1 nicotinate phosphoribosyltransferase [Legionella pneumophila subsp. pneumophila]
MINITGTYTDQYQLAMAQVCFLKGQHERIAAFDYFFRVLPFKGGYAIFAGLEDLLDVLEQLRFEQQDIEFLQHQNMHPDFIHYLQQFKFNGTVYTSLEGDVVFPTRPVVIIEANLIEAQIIETLLLNILNFQTLIATKARRIRQVAGERILIDFGLRRAQGAGGYFASRAAIVGGFDSTSNVRVGRDYSVPVSGTMAHSFIQSYDSEIQAFSDYAEAWPENCILLVDTYNTLQSGVPNAIKIAKEMENRGHRLKGIRLDSGDLAWLAKRARHMLDEAGLNYVAITASNQLDEYVIKNLLEQDAPIDAFGVGTNLAIGAPDAALDGVYKLAFINGQPRIKLSDTPAKITIPYQKQVYRVFERDGTYRGADVVCLKTEKKIDMMHHPFEILKSLSIKHYKKEALLHKVMENGKRLLPKKSLGEIARFSQQCFDRLPLEYKRFINPHIYKVGLSTELKMKRDQLIAEHSS